MRGRPRRGPAAASSAGRSRASSPRRSRTRRRSSRPRRRARPAPARCARRRSLPARRTGRYTLRASQIQAYQPQQIPDLLQTPEYARAVAAADPALPPGPQDLILEAMLTRQQLILAERRPELAVVTTEAALHQVVGDTEVMRAQLTRLAELSATYPQITLQVLPFATGAHPAGASGPLSILRFADAPSRGVVHLPGPNGGIILDSPPAVASHTRAFTLLRASALTPAATTQ